ncbi:MAG TPA: DUF4864 domain-containing protein [Noviherbaspirillum sp.]|nr:DUF4864 domain-containing protein [Noviherbaspirillum sp.]
MKRFLLIAGLVFGLGGPCWAHAEPVEQPHEALAITAEDAAAIHQTVQAQLQALANDDAAAAFELATLEKRMLIGSPDNFLRLMQELYEPLYRHTAVIYFKPEVVHGNAVQMVRLTDSSSRVWVAIFWMQQDDEHAWKIDGCHLLETMSVSI